MGTEQALGKVRKWALQTVMFVLTIGDAAKPKGPLEVSEIKRHRAHVIAEKLYAKAVAECGQEARPRVVIVTLVKQVLDWVAANHQVGA